MCAQRRFNPLDPLGLFNRNPGDDKESARKELKSRYEAALADESTAGKEYREVAALARQAGLEDSARRIEAIALQEDSHYQQFLSMMLTLDPNYKGMSRKPPGL